MEKNIFVILFAMCLTFNNGYSCRCDRCLLLIPDEIRVAPLKYCTEYTAVEPEIGKCKEDDHQMFEQLLKEHVKKYNNIAGSIFHFSNGMTKEIYRSAFLSESPGSMNELIQERYITTIINLYHTPLFDLTPWIKKEKELFYQFGGKKYINITDFSYSFANDQEKEAIFRKIASIISLIRDSDGNVLIHCMGGEHLSGIVYGILHKCYHNISMEAIIQEYKCHCGWQSPQFPGGYNVQNVELIQDFPVEWVEH